MRRRDQVLLQRPFVDLKWDLNQPLFDGMNLTAHLRYSTGANGSLIELFKYLFKWPLEDMLYDTLRMGEWMCSTTGVQCAQFLA